MKRSNHLRAAVALLEVLVATGITGGMLATLIAAAVALQRGFTAVDYQVTSQQDQMRAIDYITRDLQRASKVDWTNSGRMLTVTIPDQSDPINLPIHVPSIVNDVISYGGTPSSVSYFIEGTAFIRSQDGARTSISSTIEEFLGSTSGSLATFQLAFTPKFSRTDPNSSRDGTRLRTVVCLRNLGHSQ